MSYPCGGTVVAYPIRMKPGDDLVPTMEEFARKVMMMSSDSGSSSGSGAAAAAFVLTAVGSLEYVKLRMASACKDNNTDNNTMI